MKSSCIKAEVILLLGLAIFGHAEAWGADWKLFAETELYECFYDVEDTTPSSKNIVDVWTKLEYTKQGVTGVVKRLGKYYADLSYSVELWEINCGEGKDRILSMTEYSAEGRILCATSVKDRPPAWKVIPRGSIDEKLYIAVCK